MGRPLRVTVGGLAYHVLNRANRRARLFDDPCEYAALLHGPRTTGAQLRDLTLCGLEAAQGHEFMWACGEDHRGPIMN
jgi:hypothetical protein